MPDTVFLPDRIEVTRPIAAPPSAIFDIVRSPAGHVAIDASGMLQDFTGEPAEKVGDTFVIHMDRESLNDYPLGEYTVTVVAPRSNSRFASTSGARLPLASLTEAYDSIAIPVIDRLQANMRTSGLAPGCAVTVISCPIGRRA